MDLHKSTLPSQTGLRSQILPCVTDLAAPYRPLLSRASDSRARGHPSFHETLRRGAPSRQASLQGPLAHRTS